MNTPTSAEQSHQKKYYMPVRYDRECKCCGKQFVAHNTRRLFCSNKCRDVAYRRSKGQDSRIEPYKRQCICCGNEFETFNASKKTCSSACSEKNRKAREKTREKARDRKRCKNTWNEYVTIRKEKAKQNAEIKKKEREWYRAIHTVERECNICGSLFYCLDKETRCTCSTECSKENARRKRNVHNDTRINKNNLVDRDITLEKLYIRDNGICYLCGKPCDWNDYIIRDDIKICGNNYPSQDHVIPLARGGKHQWENVRLAHWMCNVKKSDTTPTYTKEMSREHARKMAIARCTNKKKTAQYTLDGKLIKIWDSTAQIERELGLNSKHIQNICRRVKSKTGNSYGYHWEYVS